MKEIHGRGDKIILDDEDVGTLSADSAVCPHKGNVTLENTLPLFESVARKRSQSFIKSKIKIRKRENF